MIKTLIYERENTLCKSVCSLLQKESIDIIDTDNFDTCVEKLKDGGLYLVIASFDMPKVVDLVLKSKSDDLDDLDALLTED
jgi:hypothetical protein